MKIININQQYLTFENPGTRILVVESGKGTGKTRWLQDNISEGSALFLTHRVALGRDISNRNNAAFYKDKNAYSSPRLVVCIDSLMSLLESDVHKGATIVIDEATQLLRHFIGETCQNNRKLIYWTLQSKLYHCNQLILLDADMNQETLDFFTKLMNEKGSKVSEEDITWVKNNWNLKDKTFKEFPTRESLELDLLNSIKQGKKCFIACDTQSQVTLIEGMVKGSAKGFLSVHGDNSRGEKQGEFIANVNELQKNYQVIAASPSLATGVDISEPWFDKVYLFGNGHASTAGDLLQAAARVRTVKEINFWVSTTKKYETEDWKDILNRKLIINFGLAAKLSVNKAKDIWALDVALDFDPSTGTLVASDKTYVEMYCQVQALENKSLNQLHGSFIEKAKTEGKIIPVKLSKAQEEAADKAKEATKVLKKAIKTQKQEAILNAEEITETQYQVFSGVQEQLSDDERLSVKKYKLTELVGGIEELLPYAVENEAKLFKAVKLQGLLRRDTKELEGQDTKYKKFNIATDLKHNVKTKELINEFLELINYENSVKLGETINCNHKPWLHGNFADWLLQRKVEFKELLGVSVPSDIREKPMQFIQTVLGLLGLKAEAKQRRVDGERIRDYYIDKSSVDLMNQIMEARESTYQKQIEEEQAELATLPF